MRHEVLPAREAAQRELERWRAGRFPSVAIAIADAVFSKQRDYGVAVRQATRPFARAFSRTPLNDFCRLQWEQMFEGIFHRLPLEPKAGDHLSDESRVQSIRAASHVFLDAGLTTPELARDTFSDPKRSSTLDGDLLAVFGIGEALVANIHMNLGVLTIKADLHVRRELAPYLDLTEDAPASAFERALAAARDELRMEPFEVDQIIWYTSAASGRACSSLE